MTVVYRDAGGYVAVEMSDGETGESIEFLDGCAYFTGVDGAEYIVHVENIVRIVR